MSNDREQSRIYAEIIRTTASHDPFSAAVHATRMPMIITDPHRSDNPIVFANDAFIKLTGYAREEVLDRNCRFLQGRDTDRDDVAKMRAAIARREPIEVVLLNYKKNGEAFWNKLLVSPVFDGDGALTYFFASQYDVTYDRERVRVLHESLAESERAWQLTPDLLSVIDFASGAFDRVNPAWTAALGWSKEEMEGKPYASFVHPDDIGTSGAAFDKARRGNPVLSFENRYRTRDGQWRWLSWLAFPQGEKLFSSTRDVTAARDNAEQLAAARKDRDRLWSMPNLLLAVAAFDSTIVAVNPGWPAILGWSEGEMVGRSYAEFIHPDDAQRSLGWAARLAAGEQVEDLVNLYRCKDGSFRSIAWTITRGEDVFHCVGRDVTLEQEQAATLARAEGQLRQSQKMEAVGQLTGGLAHDFNNLLAGISGSLELMQVRMQQGRFSDIERYMAAAQGAAKRAAALTHRLLAFSRRQTLAPKPTDVTRLAMSMQELIQRTVGPGIPVEVVGASTTWPALVDPSQLENALLNLCINARDAMPDGGRITIETANKWMDERAARQHDMPEGQYLSLAVTDTGTGMPPEVIARVFEPFYTTKPIGEGTGLGLSMIYGFAQQSGGQVRIYSEVGKGTTVCIYLPRHYGEVVEEKRDGGSAALSRSEEGETVLIVDDEPTIRMLVTDILDDLGYTAVEAGDSAAGLKVLQSDIRIDLLVSDVGLPGGMNGRQMADAARVFRPDLKVLFITGYAENAVLSNGHLAPGMAVMTKPFAMDDMAARIRSMIEAGREAKRRR